MPAYTVTYNKRLQLGSIYENGKLGDQAGKLGEIVATFYPYTFAHDTWHFVTDTTSPPVIVSGATAQDAVRRYLVKSKAEVPEFEFETVDQT